MSTSLSKPILYEYFEESAVLLLSKYKRSKLQNASANLGSNRELFCNEFLNHVLPPRLKVERGEVWDSKGKRSGQLDTIIMRDDMPSLEFGNSNAYLAEGLFSAIEIKSNLTRQKLIEAINTLKPLKTLTLHSEGLTILGSAPENVLERPLLCVFAYEGATWETIAEEISNQDAWDVIDVLSILSRGVMFKADLWFKAPDNQIVSVISGKAAALGMLYFFLVTFSTSFIARNISVRPYFEPFLHWSETGKWMILSKPHSS